MIRLIAFGLCAILGASGCAKAAPVVKKVILGGENAAARSAAPAARNAGSFKPLDLAPDVADRGYNEYNRDRNKSRR